MRVLLILFFLTPLMVVADEKKIIIEIKKSLMAPCCWSGTVYDHGHKQIENEIEKFINEGKSKEDILKYYSSIYGERIFSSPKAEGINIAVWIAPPLLALFSFAYYFKFLKTSIKIANSINITNEQIPFDKEIEKELKEMDK